VLEAWARNRGLTSIVCEVNLQPRNQSSIDFHHACGFREVGQYIGRGKPVMMMQKRLFHSE
jgi:predicted GNAT superfamily acetyltransferase